MTGALTHLIPHLPWGRVFWRSDGGGAPGTAGRGLGCLAGTELYGHAILKQTIDRGIRAGFSVWRWDPLSAGRDVPRAVLLA